MRIVFWKMLPINYFPWLGDTLSWVFPARRLRIVLYAACVCVCGGAFHIWTKQMLLFLDALAAFPRCHCFRFHQRGAASRLRKPLWVCLLLWILCAPQYFGLSGVFQISDSFLNFISPPPNHGRHRGSRHQPPAPERPPLGAAEQRVRLLEERNAAHRWSGKKRAAGSLLRQMKPFYPSAHKTKRPTRVLGSFLFAVVENVRSNALL